MEIYGHLPIPTSLIDAYNKKNGTNYTISLIQDRATIIGTSTANENEYSCVISLKLYITDIVPVVEENDTTQTSYDKTIITSSAVIIKTNEALDVISISEFSLVDYNTGESFNLSFDNLIEDYGTRITILNYMNMDIPIEDLINLMKEILEELKSFELPDLNGSIYTLSDGAMVLKEETNSLGQLVSVKRWEGTYPLDVMVNIMAINLDNLVDEGKIKGDSYAQYYTTLFQKAMELGVELEKNRWALIIDGFIKCLNLKIQALVSLAEFQNKQAQFGLYKAQTRTLIAQYKGFGANNKQKLYATQVEGATSAFAAGMTETAPPIFNNAEIMGMHTSSKADMEDL